MAEDIIVKELRQKIDQQKPKEGKTKKVSRDEALLEGEYILKRTLMENRPKSLEEANQILQNAMRMIYAYFRSLDYDISPQEFISYITRKL